MSVFRRDEAELGLVFLELEASFFFLEIAFFYAEMCGLITQGTD